MIFLCRKLVGNRYFALKQYNSYQAKISNPFKRWVSHKIQVQSEAGSCIKSRDP